MESPSEQRWAGSFSNESIQKGKIYNGQFLEGEYHGTGHLTEGKYTYLGSFVHGKKDGFGVQTYPDKSTYKGEWKNGVRQGFGMLETKIEVLFGQFSNGDPHGYCRILSNSEEERYEFWKNGTKSSDLSPEQKKEVVKLIAKLMAEHKSKMIVIHQ